MINLVLSKILFLLEDANQEAKVYYFFRVSNSRHQRKQQAMTATRTLLETQRVENARFKEQEEARKKKEKDDYVFFWAVLFSYCFR